MEKLSITALFVDKNEKLIGSYQFNMNNADERRVFTEQCNNALRAHQVVTTYASELDNDPLPEERIH